MRRADSFEKTLMLGKIEGGRRRGWQRIDGWMASLTQWSWVRVSSRSWGWTGKPGLLQSTGLQRVGQDWATEVNWTELSKCGRTGGEHLSLLRLKKIFLMIKKVNSGLSVRKNEDICKELKPKASQFTFTCWKTSDIFFIKILFTEYVNI